jgi:hypothetical protein
MEPIWYGMDMSNPLGAIKRQTACYEAQDKREKGLRCIIRNYLFVVFSSAFGVYCMKIH